MKYISIFSKLICVFFYFSKLICKSHDHSSSLVILLCSNNAPQRLSNYLVLRVTVTQRNLELIEKNYYCYYKDPFFISSPKLWRHSSTYTIYNKSIFHLVLKAVCTVFCSQAGSLVVFQDAFPLSPEFPGQAREIEFDKHLPCSPRPCICHAVFPMQLPSVT